MTQNTRRQILTPMIFAVLLALGIFIGRNFFPNGNLSFKSPLTVYPQTNKLDAILNLIEEEYVDTVDTKKIVEHIIPELLKDLDPHTVYIPAKDLTKVNEELQGNFGGIGVQFSMQKDSVLVIKVISGGPSEKVGLMAGDRIVTVNDTAFVGDSINSNMVMNKLRGEMGTMVKVGIVRPPSQKIIPYEITRGTIPIYSVDASYMVDSVTGYIKVERFAQTTYQEFVTALAKLKAQEAQNVIVDLRGNSGGLLDVAINMCNEFLARKELIVYTEGKAQARQDVYANGAGTCQDTKVIVLIDEFSASASEIFAGAIQDNDRGVVIGRRSFGKGLVQQQIPLPDASAIRLTVARYYTPAGRCIQKSYENGNEDYFSDIYHRYENGEFFNQDSIHFNDSVQYKTKNGRIVYGGGGIMPDVFVARDTTLYTSTYVALRSSGAIYQYALEFSDKHRKELDKYTSAKAMKKYLDQQDLMTEFLAYAKGKKVEVKPDEYIASKVLIDNEVKAYIARNVIDNDGFYPIINEVDEVFIKGVEMATKELE